MLLKDGAAGYTWVAATVGSESAAPFQLASGDPIMAIGGFNGTDPAPTLAQFEKYVSEHKIHYFIGRNQASFGGDSGDAAQITAWVQKHFTSQTIAGITVYNTDQPGLVITPHAPGDRTLSGLPGGRSFTSQGELPSRDHSPAGRPGL